jgi:hypothetical protein
VAIADAEKQIVEQGFAVSDASGLWWTYTATKDCLTTTATVVAHVEDLTGHWVEREAEKR